MPKILRILSIGLGFVVAALAAYFAWCLARAHMFFLLFLIFMGAGAFCAIGGIISHRRALWGENADLFLVSASSVSSARVYSFLMPLQMLVVLCGGWLYPMCDHLLKHSAAKTTLTLRNAANDSALLGTVARVPPATLALAITGVLVMVASRSHNIWTTFFLDVLIIQTMLRHILYWLSPISLPMALRRSIGNAYLMFLVVAASDLLILVLIFSAFSGHDPTLQIGTLQAVNVGKALLFGSIWDVVTQAANGHDPHLIDVATAIAGALYSRTILDSLLKIKEFRRTDEDKIFVGSSYCTLGRFTEGVSWFKNVDDSSLPLTIKLVFHAAYGQALLALSQFKRAEEQIDKGLRLFEVPHSLSNSAPFLALAISSTQFPVPQRAKIEFVAFLLDQGIGDEIAAFLLSLPGIETVSSDDREALLGSQFGREEYPLAFGVHLLACGKNQEAAEMFSSVIPNGNLGRLIRVVLLLTAECLSSPTTTLRQDLLHFDKFTSVHRKEISEWLLTPSFGSVDRLIGVALLMKIHVASHVLGSQYEQEWRFILEETLQTYMQDRLCKVYLAEVTNVWHAVISRIPVVPSGFVISSEVPEADPRLPQLPVVNQTVIEPSQVISKTESNSLPDSAPEP